MLHQTLQILLIGIIISSILTSNEQEQWLKSYRLRLEELKAHEERGGVDASFSSFHVKRYRQLSQQNSLVSTIERSIEEKYHIEWQLHQVELRAGEKEAPFISQQDSQDVNNNLPNTNTANSNNDLSPPIPLSRHLEDAFSGLYTNTYGTNMFCGTSWAEASSSCPTRQNCPSGQNDECLIPGQQCWAFTECDTRYGHGEQFADMHGVVGGANLAATGVGAEASGGYVDLSKPSNDPKDHYFCGKGYEDALSKCSTNCPSGSLNDCPDGEICFFNTPCDARLMTRAPSPPSPTVSPTTPAPVVYSSKINKYYCGYDWDDAQERCEVWCPSASDDDCPEDQLCFAFSKCHAADMNGMTLAQMEENQANNQNGSGNGGVGMGGPPTPRPTQKPSISAEVAMHRHSFCGAHWADARDNCETKQHCEDDRDCPEFEQCWTQTPCDFLATEAPTDPEPTGGPTPRPVRGEPSTGPTVSPIGPPSKKPTPAPVTDAPIGPPSKPPTASPTGKPTPTYAPTTTFKPTDIPTNKPIGKNDPAWSFFCGESWAHADETCMIRCTSGNSQDCPATLECWAFTSCKREKGYITEAPTYEPTPAPVVIYVPGLNGAQVPVFGGINYEVYEPTVSPAPTITSMPSLTPSLPPGVVSKITMASYYCGTDWNDVVKNCHQPCPSGESSECENPEHFCWAFVEACRARTPPPSEAPVSESPTLSPITEAPTRDPSSPTTPEPTLHPTDIYDLLAKQSQMFYCAVTWDGIVCGSSTPCPSGSNSDCPEGESCFQSEIDCSKPQPTPAPTIITEAPITSTPTVSLLDSIEVEINEAENTEAEDTVVETDNSQDNMESEPENNESNEIDNEDEEWDDASTNIDNEGEDWGDESANENIDNEGEDWGSPVEDEVDNSGEDWSIPETSSPTPKIPTWEPTPEPTIDLLSRLEDLKQTMFCASSWDEIDCENAKPCPSGSDDDCPKRQQCFSGASCQSSEGDEEEETIILDETTSKFFCGSSWDAVINGCDTATPCPSGTNGDCPEGEQCFADTPCISVSAESGSVSSYLDFASMVSVPPYCDDKDTMSRNVGYWQSWSIYRDESCNLFTPESIDASSYTHIVYSFAAISSDGTLDAWNSTEEIGGGIYQSFLDVKNSYPDVKIMVAVGGWTHNDPDNERLYRFSRTSATQKARVKFAQSAVAFLRKYGFHGLDLDWEYPVVPSSERETAQPELSQAASPTTSLPSWTQPLQFHAGLEVAVHLGSDIDGLLIHLSLNYDWIGDEDRGGDEKLDKKNYALLCSELRKYFDQAPEKFELSMAVPAPISKLQTGFDFIELQKSVHFFGVMAYDLHGIWDDPRITGAHSDIVQINEAIDYMMTDGNVPSSQIILGLSAYGRSYTLENKTCTTLGCPFREDSNETAIGGCLETTGFVPYVEIHDWTEEGKGKGYNSITVDPATASAFMVKDRNQFISYDNPESFQAKVDYASEKCLGGTMVWAIDMIPVDGKRIGSSSGAGGSETGESSGEASDTEGMLGDAYCGKTWEDSLTCKKPCPSGTTDECGEDEMCFAGTPCGEGGAGRPVRDSCKICPDSTKQGIRTWVNIDIEINGTVTSTSCGDIDYSVFLTVPRKSEECDAAQLAHEKECCYNYPDTQCWLCQKDSVFYTVRSDLNITLSDGSEVSCGLADKMLSPSEASSQRCITSRDSYFDDCCYRQCSLCEGQGLKWWVEFETEDAIRNLEDNTADSNSTTEEGPPTCSSIDGSLYSDFVEAGTEECNDVTSVYRSECCYEYPTWPCGLCQRGNDTLTLLWANTVDHNGKNVSCGVLADMLNSEPNDSPICTSERDAYFDTCCFDKCSLCGEKFLAWDFVVDTEAEKTCGQIEAEFTANEIYTTSDECTATKEDFHDICCFIMPSTPCNLCEEYVRWDDEVEFDGSKSSCKEVSELLRREEEDSDICLATKEDLQTACCYKLCDVCGESLMLDWDLVIAYEEDHIACGDLKAVFGKEEIEDGTEECVAVQDVYRDMCCFTPPVSPCNLCQTETDYLDAYSDVAVDFFGTQSNCSDVYDYLFRRIESDSETCISSKNSSSNDCCYKKCSICEGNQVQDLQAKVTFDGRNISCLQLHTVTTLDVPFDGQDCSNLKSAFSESCCYDAPDTPCVMCAEGAVRKDIMVDFNGEAQTCENVGNYIGSRMNNGTEECDSYKAEFMDYCCFDKCSLCSPGDQIDWDTFVEFQEGLPDVSCGSFDWFFTSHAIEEGTGNCTVMQEAYSERCCYTPIDYTVPACSLCKQGDEWYDVNGPAIVEFENENKTCTHVTNSLFRKAEDSSDLCIQAKNEYFSSCCFSKCNLCAGNQLDAMVEVLYNETATTCLELGLTFAAEIVMEGSNACNHAKSLLFEPCCYSVPADPCVLCRSDTGQGQVRESINIDFYGATTTCTDLNSFLVSREEQVGFMCQAAKAELQETCCFQKCDICNDGGSLHWDNPVQFNDLTFACGELTWILGGKMVEEGSEECDIVQDQYFDACCNGPSPEVANAGNKCEICPSAKDWYAQVTYDETIMTCLELDSVLVKKGVFEQSTECSQVKLEYSRHCCYVPPENPCNLCHIGHQSYSVMDKSVSYNGAETNCYGIHNHLLTRIEMEDDLCLTTQDTLFEHCCYDKCSLCENYQLDPNVNVMHEGTLMGCSEFDTNYFGLNEITKGSEQCTMIQQQYFNDCCFDIPCELCRSGDLKYELLIDTPAVYESRDRTCGDVSVLLESHLSQSDVCLATRNALFDSCCFMQCKLCKEPDYAVNWNHDLQIEGLASTCMDVYTSLRSEGVKEGDDKCESVKFAISHECCYKIPTNQCALCLNSNGTFLNTNWNNEVVYQGLTRTCSDVNAILGSEELDSAICLMARDDYWNDCCFPQEGGNSDEIGEILAGNSQSEVEIESEADSTSTSSGNSYVNDFSDFGAVYIRPESVAFRLHPVVNVVITILVLISMGFGLLD